MRRLQFFITLACVIACGVYAYFRYPVPLQGWEEVFRSLLLLGVVVFLVLGLGLKLLSLFPLYADSLRTRLVFAFGLGSSALAWITHVLGLAGLFNPPWLMYLVLAALGLVCSEQLEGLVNHWRRSLHGNARVTPSARPYEEALYRSLLFWVALVVLALALAPPTFYDSLLYHLAMPQYWQHVGRVLPQDSNLFSWLPGAGEMLTSFCLLIEGPLLANLFNFCFGLFLAWALLDAGERLLPKESPWLPAVLFFCQPVAALAFGILSSDGQMSFYCFLSLYAFLQYWKERELKAQKAWLLLGAFLAGSAAAAKPVAGVHAIALLLLVAWAGSKNRALLKPAFVAGFFACLLLALLPSLVRNGMLHGNPIYPFGLSVGGHELLKFGPHAYLEHMRQFGTMERPWFTWLLLPWEMMFNAAHFAGGGNLNPLMLGLLPAFFFIKAREEWCLLLVYFLICFGLWALTQQVLRYLLQFLPAACLLAAWALAELREKAHSKGWSLTLGVVIIFFLFEGAAQSAVIAAMDFDPFKVALGLESRQAYLERRVSYAAAAHWAEDHLDPNVGILVLGESRTAYLPGRPLAATVFDQHPLSQWLAESGSAEELNQRVLKNNLHYVLLAEDEWKRVENGPGPHYRYAANPSQGEILRSWMDQYWQLRYHQNGCSLFHLRSRPIPLVPQAIEPQSSAH